MQSDGVETTQLVPQDVVFGEDPTFLGVPNGFGHHVDGCSADYLDVSGFVSLREHYSDVQEHCSWAVIGSTST